MRLLDYLYKHWAPMCLPMAFLSLIILGTYFNRFSLIEFLIWLQVPIYLIHQFEEHACPGGFKDFVNKVIFKQEKDIPLDDRSIFWINIPVVWLGFPIFAAVSSFWINGGIWIIYVSLINGTIHIIGALRFLRYNPGLAASVFLNLPLSIYTLVKLPQLATISPLTHIISVIIAIAIHITIVGYAIIRFKKNQRTDS